MARKSKATTNGNNGSNGTQEKPTTNQSSVPTGDDFRQFADLVGNVLSVRSQFFQKMFDPRRDIDDECGYKPVKQITAWEYQEMHDSDPIANRVNEVYAKESWQVQPQVYEDEDPEVITPFETTWNELSKQLRGEGSFYQDECGSVIWEYLRRADELSGIGRYGVILIGVNDGKALSQPAFSEGEVVGYSPLPEGTDGQYIRPFGEGEYGLNAQYTQVPLVGEGVKPERESNKPTRKLLFLRVFPETLVEISRYESNSQSPRFGQPLMYRITLSDPSEQTTGTGLPTQQEEVHWTRVVHIADNLASSEVMGIPRLQTVFHRVQDLVKLYGGSAEMYWRGAFPGYSLESEPGDGEGDIDVDMNATRDAMEKYMNGLQRFIALMGWKVKSLAPQVVDPTPQICTQIEAICIKLGIPKRIFMGTERGELASSQDDAAWNDRIRARQNYYITPKIIAPFVDRLIAMGILPRPVGFSIFWPDLTSQTGQEKSQIAFQRTQALAQFATSGAAAIMSPVDYLLRIQGFNEIESRTIFEAAVEFQKTQAEELGLVPPAVTEEKQADKQLEADKQQFDKELQVRDKEAKVAAQTAKTTAKTKSAAGGKPGAKKPTKRTPRNK